MAKKKMIIICTAASFLATADCQTKKQRAMKLNAGIITHKIAQSKAFYTQTLGFSVKFENDFYLLLQSPGNGGEISFLQPNHPSQQSLFHREYTGQGVYLTIEVSDVDQIHQDLKNKGVAIAIELRDEPWGDRHFSINDPNGLAIDIVSYSPQN